MSGNVRIRIEPSIYRNTKGIYFMDRYGKMHYGTDLDDVRRIKAAYLGRKKRVKQNAAVHHMGFYGGHDELAAQFATRQIEVARLGAERVTIDGREYSLIRLPDTGRVVPSEHAGISPQSEEAPEFALQDPQDHRKWESWG